jgi:hypothetical protein
MATLGAGRVLFARKDLDAAVAAVENLLGLGVPVVGLVLGPYGRPRGGACFIREKGPGRRRGGRG